MAELQAAAEVLLDVRRGMDPVEGAMAEAATGANSRFLARELHVREGDRSVSHQRRRAVPLPDRELAQLHPFQLQRDVSLAGQQAVLRGLLLRLDRDGARLSLC